MKTFAAAIAALSILMCSALAYGAPVPLDSNPVVNDDISVRFGGVGTGAQSLVPTAAAFDGTNYLVAWAEYRTSSVYVFASRVSEAGAVLDSPPKVLASFPRVWFFGISAPRSLSVVHGKGGYVVTWVDAQGYAVQYVKGVRVKNDGTVVDTTPLDFGQVSEQFSWNILGGNFSYPTAHVVAAVDDGCMALSLGPNSYVNGQEQRSMVAVSYTGLWGTAPLVRTSVTLSSSAQTLPALTSDGSGYYAAWQDSVSDDAGASLRTRLARLEAAGGIVWKKDEASGFLADRASFSGGHALFTSSKNGTVSALRVDPSGSVSPPLSLPSLSRIRSVVPKGAGFLASASSASDDFCGQNLDALGNPVGACIPSGETAQESPPVLVLGTTSVLAGSYPAIGSYSGGDSRANAPYKLSLLNATTFAKTASVTLSRASNAQTLAAVAFDGQQYLAVWVDDRDSEKDPATSDPVSVYAVRVSGDGVPGTPTKISESHLTSAGRPAITFDGSKFFVVWPQVRLEGGSESGALASVEVASSTSGPTIVPVNRLQISGDNVDASAWPAVASDGENRLVVWIHQGGPLAVAARVSIATGQLLDPTPILLGEPGASSFQSGAPTVTPAVAFDGEQFLIVFPRTTGLLTSSLAGVLLKKGAALPTSAPFAVQQSLGVQLSPSIASDGKTGFFLAWSDLLSTDGSFDVRGKLIGKAELENIDTVRSFSLGVASNEQSFASTSYANDDVGYGVTWPDFRDATHYRLYTSFVGRDGRVFGGESGELFDSTSTGDAFPALTPGPSGKMGLVYSHFDTRTGYGNERIYFASLSSGALRGGSCVSADECASHYCVGGVCCESACEGSCATCAVTVESRGTCGVAAKGTICGENRNYVCGGSTNACSGACDTNAECVSGFSCVEHACVGAQVSECLDEHTLINGFSCGDYRCVAGTCATTCVSSDDCANRQVCDFDGRCIAPPVIDNPADGCSTSTLPDGKWGLALMFSAVALVLGRRRTRR